MFRGLCKVAHIAVDTATMPVALAADIVTLGGELTDRHEPYAVSKAKSIAEKAESLFKIDGDQ